MSRQRVVVGTDDRGRPKTAWAEPEPADERRYGHMEPAYDSTTIERRQATPEELAARQAASEPPMPFRTAPVVPKRATTPADVQQSRLNGARRHVEVLAERRAAVPYEEVPPMPAPLPAVARAEATLDDVIAARRAADAAFLAKQAAVEAWVTARTALEEVAAKAATDFERAMEELQRILDQPPGDAGDRIVAFAAAIPTAATKPSSKPKAAKKPGGDAQRHQDADARALEVIAVLERHGGDTKAAGDELGVRGNVVGRIVSSYRARHREATA
jgi:hypothetical protein